MSLEASQLTCWQLTQPRHRTTRGHRRSKANSDRGVCATSQGKRQKISKKNAEEKGACVEGPVFDLR